MERITEDKEKSPVSQQISRVIYLHACVRVSLTTVGLRSDNESMRREGE